MDWPLMEDIYLIFTRIFDGFLKFLVKTFGVDDEE